MINLLLAHNICLGNILFGRESATNFQFIEFNFISLPIEI